MIKKEINLSDVAEYFKSNQIQSFDEDMDQYGQYFITAGRIAAVILAPDPFSKIAVFCAGIDAGSIQVSKLFSWLPDKFKWGKKGRERFAIERYELSSAINIKLLDIAIKLSLKEFIMPLIEVLLNEIKFEPQDKENLKKLAEKVDEELEKYSFSNHTSLSLEDSTIYASKLVDPILPFLYNLAAKYESDKPNIKVKEVDLQKPKEQYLNKINLLYNSFIINFSSEFPEFAVWSDVTKKSAILKELNKISKSLRGAELKSHQKFISDFKELANKIEQLDEKVFSAKSGFPSFKKHYEDLFQLQTEKLESSLTEKIRENIKAHQNKIKSELTRPLSNNEDIEEIVYPKNKEIFISQSFEAINYKKREHGKKFLTSESLSEKCEAGEDIGKYLLKALVDPTYATKPIVILGNPGAGKSMLSKMFAGELCETTDFIPFLIKLRNVASSSANISEHINKGLALSIENTNDINWLDWAKEFRERTPVVIMDGFDELMQSSSTELNGYINTIKDFQETAMHHNICVRVILTSRVAVMQDVTIPEETKVIKLNGFDEKRRELWVEKWNSFQTKKDYKFSIPKNEKVETLAQEPLLLFMLAVYDFEKTDLKVMSKNRDFNQSKLYDSLLSSFADRQLKKNKPYEHINATQQKEEKELFRLRLGMIALMMFLNDTTNKDTQKLNEELEAFKLNESKIQTSDVLGGFFFIHENKSVTEGQIEKYNYEFLHKTFGEFLTADFLLRTAVKQADRRTRNEQLFKFCFGYNWLHKHNNIQNFLFEHAHHIIKLDSEESKYVINEIIIPDLEKLFDKITQDFPVVDIRILAHKSKVEHLAIYSQNLIFLWIALIKDKTKVKFEIYDCLNNDETFSSQPKYEAQDREEINKNKILWKRLSNLWSLVGNKYSTAKLTEWVTVSEETDYISLTKYRDEIKHNFLDASKVGCNDFEFLLSIFDNDLKFSEKDNILEKIEKILSKKAELQTLGVDAILYRFSDLILIDKLKLIETLFKFYNYGRQIEELVNQIIKLKYKVPIDLLVEIVHLINRKEKRIGRLSPQIAIEYLRLLGELQSYVSLDEKFHPRIFEEVFESLLNDLRHLDHPAISIEYFKLINDLMKLNLFEIRFSPRMIEEIFSRMSREFEYSIKRSPFIGLEYLRLLNDLWQLNFIRKRLSNKIFEELFYRISQETEYFENPQFLVEYLKLISKFGDTFPIERIIPFKLIERLVYNTSKNLEYMIRHIPETALEYLSALINLKQHFSPEIFEEAFLPKMSEEIFHRFIDFIKHNENPLFYTKYLKLVNQLRKFVSIERSISRQIINQLLLIGLEEYRHIIRNNLQLALNYLELSNDFDLIKNNDPILIAFPKLKAIYSRDPQQFGEFLDVFAQINEL